jgi:N-acetylglucosamine malate deacetylase 1
MPEPSPCRVLMFGAHPDDAEVFAAGLLIRHCQRGSVVKIISVTDGRSGHHETPPDELVQIRRREAHAAGQLIGAEYMTWDFPDGSLQADIEVRSAIIREARRFQPDLILTHRPNDYHPDHRAVGQAVQDASYMMTVPHVCADTPALRRDPVVAYMSDLFTRPNPLRPDIILDVKGEFDTAVRMAACHQSQFFQWLPYHDGLLSEVPQSDADRLKWLHGFLLKWALPRVQHFKDAIRELKNVGHALETIEVYEVSEYAAKLDENAKSRLFPDYLT